MKWFKKHWQLLAASISFICFIAEICLYLQLVKYYGWYWQTSLLGAHLAFRDSLYPYLIGANLTCSLLATSLIISLYSKRKEQGQHMNLRQGLAFAGLALFEAGCLGTLPDIKILLGNLVWAIAILFIYQYRREKRETDAEKRAYLIKLSKKKGLMNFGREIAKRAAKDAAQESIQKDKTRGYETGKRDA